MEDSYLLGIWEEFNFRFLITDCSNAVEESLRRQNLTNSSADLVAKSMIGAFFLAGMVKEETLVNIQLEGDGPIERVLTYSDRMGRMRGMSKHPSIQAKKEDPSGGIGKGFFKVARWEGAQQIHQSVTKLEKVGFESNLLQHIYESDQLVSFLSIFTDKKDNHRITKGIILQALPGTAQKKIDDLKERMSNIQYDIQDLFQGSLEDVLNRLEETLQSKALTLETGIPEFYCGCSLEKIKRVIVSMGRDEAFSIVEEQGKIEIVCEFCKEKYNLDAEEVKLLFI
jgi:molecular chaperone Hsp33